VGMEDYVFSEQPFYVSGDGYIKLYQAVSASRRTRPIVIRRQKLTADLFQTDLPRKVDDFIAASLSQVRNAGLDPCRLLEVYLDVHRAPDQYYVFHVVEMRDGITSVQLYMRHLFEESLTQPLLDTPSTAHELVQSQQGNPAVKIAGYDIDSELFAEAMAKLYKGTTADHQKLPIVVKCHEFSRPKYRDTLSAELSKAINAGIVQARIQHPRSCRILDLHVNVTGAPIMYYVHHVLEALESDLYKEIVKKKAQSVLYSEADLWDFLTQLSSVMAFSHDM